MPQHFHIIDDIIPFTLSIRRHKFSSIIQNFFIFFFFFLRFDIFIFINFIALFFLHTFFSIFSFTDYSSWFGRTKYINNWRSYLQSCWFRFCTWCDYVENLRTEKWRKIANKVLCYISRVSSVDVVWVSMMRKWQTWIRHTFFDWIDTNTAGGRQHTTALVAPQRLCSSSLFQRVLFFCLSFDAFWCKRVSYWVNFRCSNIHARRHKSFSPTWKRIQNIDENMDERILNAFPNFQRFHRTKQKPQTRPKRLQNKKRW